MEEYTATVRIILLNNKPPLLIMMFLKYHRICLKHFLATAFCIERPAAGPCCRWEFGVGMLVWQSPRHRPDSGASVFQRGACRSRFVRPGRSRSDQPAARCRRHTGNTEGANNCSDPPDWQTQLCLHRRSACHTGKINLVEVEQGEGY